MTLHNTGNHINICIFQHSLSLQIDIQDPKQHDFPTLGIWRWRFLLHASASFWRHLRCNSTYGLPDKVNGWAVLLRGVYILQCPGREEMLLEAFSTCRSDICVQAWGFAEMDANWGLGRSVLRFG